MPKRLNARSLSLTSQESYSAVIIADLIADVQDGQQNKGITNQETNLSCDGKKVPPSAAVVNVDSSETVHSNSAKINGTDISKGVILNALQFGQGDAKLTDEVGKHIPMQAAGEEPKEKLQKESLSFQEMSLPRKIAFFSSFLPSILFVLCFAVILPCNKLLPCAQDQWFVTYNDTEITSDLKILQNLVFSFVNKEGAGVRGVAISTGEDLWETKLLSSSSFIECGYLMEPETRSCLVMDDKGTLHIIDPIKGNILWMEHINDTEIPSLPTIISDCNKDGIDEIVFAVSNSKLLVFSQGNKTALSIPDCDSLPTKMLVWETDNENNLLLICQKGENETLMKIPQNLWCDKKEANNGTTSNLISTNTGFLSQLKIQPIREGLLAWSEDMVKMLTIDGKEKWILSNVNNSNKNQFLFEGRFKKNDKKIILISNSNSKNIQIAKIDKETGKILKTSLIPNTEISDAVLIYGETRDFILTLKRKFTKSLRNEAVSQLNEMSSTVISILAKEEIDVNTLNTSLAVNEEVTIMDLNGKDIQTLHFQAVSYLKGGSQFSTLAVSEEKKEETKLLRVFLLNKSPKNSTEIPTTLKSIQVANWDVSSSKVSHCVWK